MTYEIELISTSELTPYARNARTHSEEQIAQISASIKEFGFNNPVLIDNDNGIIAGHGRVMAADALGIKDVPCIRLKHLSDEQKRAYIIADNQLALNAGWNPELLKLEITDLIDADFNVDLLGFSDAELSDILGFDEPAAGLTDEDQAPEVEQEAITKTGDVWVLGKHRVMCGDSTIIDNVESLLGGDSIDLCYTDPPYGINIQGDRSNRGGLGKGGLAKARKYDDFIDDDISYAIDAFNIVENILKIKRQVWWGANYYCHSLPLSNNWFVWDKRVEEKQKDTQSDCELAWVKSEYSSIRIFRHLWKGMMKDSEKGQARVHPTQKPVALAEWAFDYFKKVESVLDLFGGSGSTLIACEKTGRQARLMELDPKYCDVIVKRWQNFTGLDAVLESTGETFNKLAGLVDADAAA